MRRHGNTRRTKHEQKYTIICEWCGEHKETSRDYTKTCGPTCRKRLSGYVLNFGYPPDEPPGPVALAHAIGVEVHRLIMAECKRRKERAAYIAATGKEPPRQ